MKKTIVVSGSGGQGVMSCGIMLANTAVDAGMYASYLPEYGPEQRGGSAKCTVVINETEIISPLAKKCDVLIAMNEQAYAKFISTLKQDGILIVNKNRLISEIKRTDINVIDVPADDISVELGNTKCANIIMLGALIGASESFITKDAMVKSLDKKFASKKAEVLELNMKALEMGIDAGKKALNG